MIIDVARHKFYEGIITLILVTILAVVRSAVVQSVDVGADDLLYATAPLQPAICNFETAHPILAALLSAMLIMHTSLRLARATLRFKLYESRTMAVMSLTVLTIAGFAIVGADLTTLIVASLAAETLSRLFYCMTTLSRPHYLFTAMIAMGAMPLIDSSMLALFILVPLMIVFMHGRMRDVVVALVGVVLPLFTYCYVVWCCGGSFSESVKSLIDNMLMESDFHLTSYLTLPRLILAGVVLFVQLCSMLLYSRDRLSLSLSVRNIWNFLQLVLILLTAIFIFIPSSSEVSIISVLLLSVVMQPLFYIRINEGVSIITYAIMVFFSIAAMF